MTHVFDFKDNTLVRIISCNYKCSFCDAAQDNITFEAYARGEYLHQDGVKRRRFDFAEGNPVCDCKGSLYLAGKDDSLLVYEVEDVL